MFSLIVRNGVSISVRRYSLKQLAIADAKNIKADEVIVALCDKHSVYRRLSDVK